MDASTVSTMSGYGAFWRAYFAKQGVDPTGRPLESDLERRVAELERRDDELEHELAALRESK
jgi:LPS sulfotransferase NodH